MICSKLLKNEKGAATIVEASIIMPIVFLIVCFLFIMGYYQLEIATLQSRADRIADIASRIVAQPGYRYYGEIETKKIDFENLVVNDSKISLSKDTIKKIYKDLDPYRYWGSGEKALDITIKTKLENIVKETAYMNPNSSEKSVDIKAKKTGLSNKVQIIVKSNVKLPDFLKYFGLPTSIEKEISSVAFVADSSEFLRNTDIVFDLSKFLADKCQLSDNISDIINKMKKQFEFLGLE